MKFRHSLRQIRGLSLIELMIALVLGLIVSAAAIALFSTSRLSYSTSESMGRLQESGRTTFELMSRDIREAGGNYCDSGLVMRNGLNAPTGAWWKNWNNGLIGYDGATAMAAPDVAFGTAVGNRVAGTEALELKYGELPSSAQPNIFVTTNMTDANVTQPIAVSTVTGLTVNDLLIACDYSGATIFQASSFTGATPGTILHAQAALSGTSPGNAAAALQIGPNGNGKNGFPLPALSLNGNIAKLRATRWYVGCNGRFACDQPGGRSLFQSSLRNNPAGTLGVANDEISDGVSAMSFQYLAPGAAAYVNSAGVANWAGVSAVKVLLTFTGQDRVGTDGAPLSRQVEHVISLRNHLP